MNTIAGLSLQSTSPISTEEEQQVTVAVAAGDGGGTPIVQVNMLSDADNITIPMTTIPATEDGIDDVNPYVAIASLLLSIHM